MSESTIAIGKSIQIPLAELEFTYARSGGPGGQNVNKVNSKAIMFWDVENTSAISTEIKERFRTKYANRLTNDGVLVINSSQHRDQKQNTQACIDKLIELVAAVEFAPKKRKKTKPSRAAVEKRLTAKRAQSEKKGRRKKLDY